MLEFHPSLGLASRVDEALQNALKVRKALFLFHVHNVHNPTRSRRVVGSIPIWGSEFFPSFFSPYILTFNIMFL